MKLIHYGTACLLILLGLSVMMGWILHLPFLIQILSQLTPMQFNTALAFLLSGLGIFFLKKSTTFSAFCGILIFLLASLTLLQYITHLNLGIDQFFIKSYITTNSTYPGRMAPNTAFCFLLTALLLFFNGFFPTKKWATQLMVLFSLIIFLMGMISLSGYILDIKVMHSWGNLTGMALHTSIGFIAISLACLPLLIERFQKFLLLQGYVPSILVAAIGFVLFFISWQIFVTNEHQNIQKNLNKEAELLQNQFMLVTSENLNAVKRLFNRSQYVDDWNQTSWKSDIHDHASSFPSLVLLEKESAKNINNKIIFKKIEQAQAMEAIKICHRLLQEEPSRFYDRMNIAFTENFICLQKRNSALLAIFNTKTMLEHTFASVTDKDYSLLLKSENKVYFQTTLNTNSFFQKHWLVLKKFTFLDMQWELSLWPNETFVESNTSSIPLLFLMLGLSVTLLLVGMIRLAQLLWKNGKLLAERSKNIQLIYDVTMIAIEAKNANTALQSCLNIICKNIAWPIGHIYVLNKNKLPLLESSHIWYLEQPEKTQLFKKISEEFQFKKGCGLPGRVWESGKPIWIFDVYSDNNFPRVKACPEIGVHSAIAFPIMVNKNVIAVFEFFHFQTQKQNDELLRAFSIMSEQVGHVFERMIAKEKIDRYSMELRHANQTLKAQGLEMKFMAYHDHLTGAANRAEFEKVAEKSLLRAKRYKKHLAILMIDLDFFKNVNDTFGHEIGDLLLKKATKRFELLLREVDTLARIGGDEFAIVTDFIEKPENASLIAQNLVVAAREPFLLNEHVITISASIGIAIYPEDDETISELMRDADHSLYQVKKSGRNNFCRFNAKRRIED